MMTPWRYILAAISILLTLHLILSLTHETYGSTTSLSRLRQWGNVQQSEPYYLTPPDRQYYYNETSSSPPPPQGQRKAKAAFAVLARNSDLYPLLDSMKQMEDRFNKKFQYPYVFLNEEPFSDDFKRITAGITNAPCYYGQIQPDHWHQPPWIDEQKATAARLKMIENKVIYGFSVPYRNMCRYNSGFFFRHPLLVPFDYYWRVEPGVKFFCDLDYDPFLIMQDQKKVYGFTISLYEYPETIETLWDTTKEFMELHPEYMPKDNALSFISDDNGEHYNRCHFWSNFEIGDLNFWRGEAYTKYFEYLDKAGGFYYERWGDAPVHSIGAALFAHKDQIHFFNDIGYKHEPFMHCPTGEAHSRGKCGCDPASNFDYEWYSCLSKFDKMF
ncbi:glycosyltransferase family 15 protein [Dacryopinax primogenitus]|uniref:Glycosyltransferase family 15 protein n=1 Tax=Dacryopinax primogenitus (strain DJM 731) TaxID=1858805 RepID=M5GA17_DACPD|nr:glycosyltransferase family 15 protein [Dacryopinax primogenitus]EJU05659.1 glycosyltransferase family 15 protein [Dacryopinax primogenitus]